MGGREGWKVVRRRVALLVALATLAERAAARSLPVRLLLFWLLGRAETVALGLFADPPDILADAARDTASGFDPCDLLRLAVSFRLMALLLAQDCPATGPADPAAAGLAASGPDVHVLRSLSAGRGAVPIADTS